MTPQTPQPNVPQSILPQIEALGALIHRPGSLIWMAALLIAAGCVGIFADSFSSMASVGLMGGFALIAGIMQALHTVQAHGWRALSLQLAIALLYIVSGLLVWAIPLATLSGLTLCLAALFLLTGSLRIRLAWQHRSLGFIACGLPLICGLLSLLLGALVLAGWPSDSLWLPGLVIGIELLLQGSTLLSLGLAIRRVSHQAVH